jgi:hypothetical protein
MSGNAEYARDVFARRQPPSCGMRDDFKNGSPLKLATGGNRNTPQIPHPAPPPSRARIGVALV